jgi:hypothetical protein
LCGGFFSRSSCCRAALRRDVRSERSYRGIKPLLQKRSGESSLRHIPVQKRRRISICVPAALSTRRVGLPRRFLRWRPVPHRFRRSVRC